jgi:hypothetical protein
VVDRSELDGQLDFWLGSDWIPGNKLKGLITSIGGHTRFQPCGLTAWFYRSGELMLFDLSTE